MAWDATQPTDTTKIRNLGTVIRPNWVAIEQAESTFRPYAINFINRTVAALPVDPTAIADTYIQYCKTATTGGSEVFIINPSSNVIQMTRGVPALTTAGRTFLPGGMLLQWGQVNFGAQSQAVVFSTAFTGTPFALSLIADTTTPSSNGSLGYSALTNTGFTAYQQGNGALTVKYMAIGV